MHPTLPPTFVPRPNALNHLRELVLSESDSAQPIALSALHGLGGIGKTLLATALCHDPEIVARFPDGMVWIDIGRDTVNLAEKMKTLGIALGDLAGFYTNAESAQKRLSELLAEKAVLVVLDDVWESAHVQPFLVDAPRCRILFTTRDGRIADALSAAEMRLDVLHPDEAIQVLTQFAGHEDLAFPQIAAKLGYLPLALKLVGASLRQSGRTGAEWLSNFQDLTQLHDETPIDRYSSVKFSFDLSLQTLSETDKYRYGTLGIFPEDVLIPDFVLERLWGENPTGSLHHFERLALLDRQKGGVRLHDLLRDYARLQLGEDYRATQQKLLEVYNPDKQHWATIPHDGYLYDHLAYHLLEAGQADELYTLLTESKAWREAKFAACIGDISFVKDMELAIRQFQDPLSPDELRTLIKLWTVRQVVNQQVNAYSQTDLEALVWLGREQEAFAHARLQTHSMLYFEYLLAIYKTLGKRDGVYPAELFEELHGIAPQIAYDDEEHQPPYHQLVTAYLEQDRLNEAITCAAKILNGGSYIVCLSEIFIYCIRRALPQAEAILAQIQAVPLSADHMTRVYTLSHLVDDVPSDSPYVERLARLALAEAERLTAPEALRYQLSIHLVLGNIDTAMQLYHRIVAKEDYRGLVTELATALIEAGEVEQAIAFAESASHMHEDEWHSIVAAVAQSGDLIRALALIEKYATSKNRYYMLSEIAFHQAQRGMVEQAVARVKTFPTDTPSFHLKKLMMFLIEQGQISVAQDLLEHFRAHKFFLGISLLDYYLRQGDLDAAHPLIDFNDFSNSQAYIDAVLAMTDPTLQTQALAWFPEFHEHQRRLWGSTLACYFARQGNPDRANAYLAEVIALNHEVLNVVIVNIAEVFATQFPLSQLKQLVQLLVETPNQVVQAWKSLALKVAPFPPPLAHTFAEQLADYLATVPTQTSTFYTTTLIEVWHELGEYDKAQAVLETWIAHLSPDQEGNRSHLVAIAASWLAEYGLFEQVDSVLQGITDASYHMQALAKLAQGAFQLQRPALAETYLARANELFTQGTTRNLHYFGVIEVIETYLQQGRFTEAITLIQPLNGWLRESSFDKIMQAYLAAGQLAEALAMLTDVMGEYRQIAARRQLAETFARHGDLSTALRLLDEGWHLMQNEELPNYYLMAHYGNLWHEIGASEQSAMVRQTLHHAAWHAPEATDRQLAFHRLADWLNLSGDFVALDALFAEFPIWYQQGNWWHSVATAYCQRGQWAQAFALNGICQQALFVSRLCEWLPDMPLEALPLLQEVTRIAGWYDQGWRDVHAVLMQ